MMWKLLIGVVIVAAIAMFVLKKGAGEANTAGSKPDISALPAGASDVAASMPGAVVPQAAPAASK